MLAFWAFHAVTAPAQCLEDEGRRIRWHHDEQVSLFRRDAGPPPVTVAGRDERHPERFVTLNEALRMALQHSEVIRVLAGVSATSSGQTVYDTAIATTSIDQARAPFDPVFRANSQFRRNERPFLAGPAPSIAGLATQGNDSSLGLQDLNRFGGVAEIRAFNAWDSENSIDFLSRNQPSLELSYTQPLLAGAGRAANEAPIVIARLQQEQSFFAFKGSVQSLVRGVISAYWSLVQARTELWAREQQVEQARFAYELVEAKFRSQLADRGDVTQPKVAYANFRANLIAAQAAVLQREAALRNLIGLPPEDGSRIVPSTPPTRDRVEFRWEEILETAQLRRPDLIELNLVLMADQQRLIRNRNLAHPNLDAFAITSWNGLSGRAFNGRQVNAPFDNHNDWTLGVNFSVPLSLRQSRAQVRSAELLIARDRANIRQALHQIEHELATTIRAIDQNLLQYEAYRETRAAATENLQVQFAERQVGLSIFLDVLLAITDWGNAVASEAQALTSYNAELANLEEQTGTILATHGIRFVEEQYASVGVHGYCFEDECYPRSLHPTENGARYIDGGRPAEESFDLNDAPRRNPQKPLLRLPEAPVDSPTNPRPDPASAIPDTESAPAGQP